MNTLLFLIGVIIWSGPLNVPSQDFEIQWQAESISGRHLTVWTLGEPKIETQYFGASLSAGASITAAGGILTPVAIGATIGPATNWNTDPPLGYVDNLYLVKTNSNPAGPLVTEGATMLFPMRMAGHYGWARLHLQASGVPVLVDWAIKSTAGQSITAGVIPELPTGILAILALAAIAIGLILRSKA